MKNVAISKDCENATGNLLHYLYHQKCYKHIGIDLSRQENARIPPVISFIGKLKEVNKAKKFFKIDFP